MLKIFICEDNEVQRKYITKIVNNFVLIDDLDMELAVSSVDPYNIIEYLNDNKMVVGLYFLDVHLNNVINGVQLATMIRKFDPYGKIVFITTDSEMRSLTFEYKVEALDYILKDIEEQEFKDRIYECMNLTMARYYDESNPRFDFFTFKQEDTLRRVNIDDILYFETTSVPHKIKIVLSKSYIEFYGSIRDIELAHKYFIRINKSCVANVSNIKEVRKANKLVLFEGGILYEVSFRRIGELIKRYDEYNEKVVQQ